ncbi:hypothetical protein BCR44DRAFT_358302 [Catenaria anguillulae PL171]|uniref:Uncharacterized protein n=1 Tax=Catenaria anguillulae PL171 TaxID=765915 RepID=A0A1Y2H7Q8_9FUNG|nr:hypothetical protein BCR44DRAFT_358302 [Catenaria anguillulae PL171]
MRSGGNAANVRRHGHCPRPAATNRDGDVEDGPYGLWSDACPLPGREGREQSITDINMFRNVSYKHVINTVESGYGREETTR